MDGDKKALLVILTTFAIVISAIAIYLSGILQGSLDKSHTEEISFDSYLLSITVFGVIAIVGFAVGYWGVKSLSGGNAAVCGILTTFAIFGLVYVFIGLVSACNTYNFNAETSDITLQTNAGAEQATLDLGNYTVLSANVEEYATKDDSLYNRYRILAKDDKVRITIRLNNTAYWNETQQNLTDVTARLKGYRVPKLGGSSFIPKTEWISPNTEPGDVDYSDISVLVFDGIDYDPLTAYYVFEVLNNESEVLGTGYIHPQIKQSEQPWFMDLAA